MKKTKKAASILLAGALLVGLPFSAIAKEQKEDKSKYVQYVALGDSLAAGQTPNGYIDYGYVDYLADSFVKNKYKLADFDNFGVPGYTTVKLKNDLLHSSKIRKEVKEATHITIDIGANDLLPKVTTPDQIPSTLGTIRANLQSVLSTIDQLNPNAKVYVMGYYNPFAYYPEAQQQALLPILKSLNNQIELVAKDNKDTYVSTETQIAQNYKEYLTNPQDIHLSSSGYKVLATEFWKAISKKK